MAHDAHACWRDIPERTHAPRCCRLPMGHQGPCSIWPPAECPYCVKEADDHA